MNETTATPAVEDRRVRVVLPAMPGKGTVHVGDTDISRVVQTVTVNAHATESLTQITLTLTSLDLLVTAEGQGRVVMTDEVRDALVALGWKPPEETA